MKAGATLGAVASGSAYTLPSESGCFGLMVTTTPGPTAWRDLLVAISATPMDGWTTPAFPLAQAFTLTAAWLRFVS